MKQLLNDYRLAGLLAIILVIGGIYGDSIHLQQLQSEARAQLTNDLHSIKKRLENNLHGDLQLVRGLISAISLNPEMDQNDFARATNPLLEGNTQLRNIGAAPDMVIRLINPLAGNEKAIGLDYRTHPAQFAAAEKARASREVVLAGPINLVQGGTGLIARLPVFTTDSSGKEQFWGLVSAVIDDKKLYANSNLYSPKLPIEIAIRGKDSLGAEGDVFFGNPELFNPDNDSVTANIELPYGSWQITAVSRALNPAYENQLWLFRLGYLVIAAILLWSFISMARAVKQASAAKRQSEKAQELLTESLVTLNERESLLRTVIDEMPDVVVLKDAQGQFILGNESVAKLYSTTPEEMKGKDDADFGVPKDQAELMRQNVLEIMQRGETDVVFEQSTDTQTGETRHYQSIKKPFKTPQGDDQILVIAHDITDIVRAQNEVAENERKLRTILDNVDAYIYLKDQAGNYLFANRAVRRLFKTEIEQIIGHNDEKFFDLETAQNIRKNDLQVLKSEQPLRTIERNTLPDNGLTMEFQSTKLPLLLEDGKTMALCGISVDITEIKRIERALRESEQRFKLAGKAAYDLVYEWHTDSDTIEWFGDVDSMLGFHKGAISHNVLAWLDLIHPDDKQLLANAVQLHKESVHPIQYEYRIQNHAGEYRYWSDNALPILDEEGKPSRWVGVCTDITDRKEQQSQLEFAAYHDKLTNLPNRVLLSDRLRQAMLQDHRRGQSLIVVYIDLDGFKEVNDNYGHDVGDYVLVTLAKRFQETLREGDTIARLGGDEFVAVLLDIDDTSTASPLLKRLLDVTAQPIHYNDQMLQLSGSLGVTFYPQHEEVEADQLIRQADQAMYQAKLTGKNRYYFFDTEYDRNLRGKQESFERIEQALQRQEFELYYQPKVNMRSGELIGVEALIRWNHPDEGVLSPAMFLPIIDEHPLSIQIGEWVIDTVVKQINHWRQQQYKIPVSVNIGALQLQQEEFVERLQQILARHDTLPDYMLELEVLETSALNDIEQVSQVMTSCERMGIHFALDDFGTGYSSLTYLKHLPAATLKIDRSFVRDMLEDPDDLAILEGVMGMSSAFRRQVIAEGVEQLEQGCMLLQLGCELAQGYCIAKPMPAAQLIQWLKEWTPPEEWKKQPRISRDDIPLLFAAIEHRAWVQQMENYVSDQGSIKPADIEHCRFSQWLNLEGKENYRKHEEFTQITVLHARLHIYGNNLCQQLKEGSAEDVEAEMNKLKQCSEQLLLQLEKLLNKKKKRLRT